MNRVQKMLKRIDKIEGWLDYQEQMALLHLPAMVDGLEGDIVEIGSYKGKSTVTLALGSSLLSRSKRPIYAIDGFEPEESFYTKPYWGDFLKNIKKHGVEDKVIPIKKYSNEAYGECPKKIAAIFIDGLHSYEGVKHDIEHYVIPRVVSGGLIAFHDYKNSKHPGVAQAVDELCSLDKRYEYVALYSGLMVIRKR